MKRYHKKESRPETVSVPATPQVSVFIGPATVGAIGGQEQAEAVASLMAQRVAAAEAKPSSPLVSLVRDHPEAIAVLLHDVATFHTAIDDLSLFINERLAEIADTGKPGRGRPRGDTAGRMQFRRFQCVLRFIQAKAEAQGAKQPFQTALRETCELLQVHWTERTYRTYLSRYGDK